MQLYAKYRPRRLAQVIGQDKALEVLSRLRAAGGLAGRVYWISGRTGTGKTTIAQCIARELADEFGIEETDAQGLMPSDVDAMEKGWHFYGWGKGGRVFIINEAHGLRADTIRKLLTALERIPAHVCVIFTTTFEGEERLFDGQIDAHPLLSRCDVLALNTQGLAGVFSRLAQGIARREGLNGRPIADYLKLARSAKNNLREMLQRVGQGEMRAER